MPLPTLKVDVNGHDIIDTVSSIPKVDASGYRISQEDLQVAREEQQETSANQEAVEKEIPKNADAEARKIFLQAQRVKRKADEDAKKASSGLAKADAFDKAVALANSGEDPTAILKAAGIDPIKFYQNMTTYALKPEQAPLSPTEAKLKDHQDRLDQYAKELETQSNNLRAKEENQMINQVLTQNVIPLLQNNMDKYETMLAEYGNNAAIQVYQACMEEYQKTGKAYSFEQMADAMEEYWAGQVDSAINHASKMKKFKDRFAAPTLGSQDNRYGQQETPTRSPTLTNKPTAPANSQTQTRKQDRRLSADERAAAVIAKFGG